MRSMTGEFENLLSPPDRCGGGSGGQGRPPLQEVPLMGRGQLCSVI